ncbi:MAG: CsbD family protein [Planctomycetaceae bacterium]|nr:CsbD family protein [Planctomycetaceae bacterium]MBV8608792.1 CsbD family protein [Singulisphaera sp.]MBV8229592.1 CsbD family protein [Planctomycetaceae bacterium]MBV8266519.1 CsbD family protein [Planctomycetaceae bacterium]MBV8315661.1 CsbD family protein [Planctomycetaceae bacterium]
MDWDRIEGNWTEREGKIKGGWGQLTDDALEQAAGRRDQLVGALQRRYGYERDRAERDLDELTRTRLATERRDAPGAVRHDRRSPQPLGRPAPSNLPNWLISAVYAETSEPADVIRRGAVDRWARRTPAER